MSPRTSLLASLRAGSLLAVAALLASLLLTGIWSLTHERIADAERRAAMQLLNELIPAELHDNDLLLDRLRVEDAAMLGHRAPVYVHRGWLHGQPTALAVEVTARDGYSGDIRLLLGIHHDGRLSGVRVIAHRETPGLGDWIETERSPWIHAFAGRALGDPPPERWKVRRDGGDFDQFTGATITPRAVVRQVAKTLDWYQQQREWLWQTTTEQP